MGSRAVHSAAPLDNRLGNSTWCSKDVPDCDSVLYAVIWFSVKLLGSC
jgi:hypothetical protein